MTDARAEFGEAELEAISHIIHSSNGRYEETDTPYFPSWQELYDAFRKAKVLLDSARVIARAANSDDLMNVKNFSARLKAMPMGIIDMEKGEPVFGRPSEQMLRQSVIDEIDLFIANAGEVPENYMKDAKGPVFGWPFWLYHQYLQKTVGHQYSMVSDPDYAFEITSYLVLREKIKPHLPARTRQLLDLKPIL